MAYSLIMESILVTKSFSPCHVTRRNYHYYHGLDFRSESNDGIWMWLLDHRSCRKLVLIHDEESMNQTKLDRHLPVSANACVDAAIPDDQRIGPGSDHSPAFEKSHTFHIIEDSSGIKWQISAEVTEQTDTSDAIQLRTYRLRSLPGKIESGVRIACESSTEYFVEAFTLYAPWSLTALPSIATFIRQVKLLLVLLQHSVYCIHFTRCDD